MKLLKGEREEVGKHIGTAYEHIPRCYVVTNNNSRRCILTLKVAIG